MPVGMSITPVIIGAQARADANEAKEIARCITTMENFQDKGSTVEQKQQYAECVNLVYPKTSMTELQTTGVFCLIFLVVSIITFILIRDKDLIAKILLSLLVGVGVSVGLTLLYTMSIAIYSLFV